LRHENRSFLCPRYRCSTDQFSTNQCMRGRPRWTLDRALCSCVRRHIKCLRPVSVGACRRAVAVGAWDPLGWFRTGPPATASCRKDNIREEIHELLLHQRGDTTKDRQHVCLSAKGAYSFTAEVRPKGKGLFSLRQDKLFHSTMTLY
jgi:hypothetical protein